MFYERIPAGASSGRTPSQIFVRYGFPHRRVDVLKALLKLPQNAPLLQASGGKIDLDTDLTRFAGQTSVAPSLCLPIDFQAAHSGKTVYSPDGLRPRNLQKPMPTDDMTHGVTVRFALVFGAAPLTDLEGRDVYRCSNVRWLQTAKRKNSPYPRLPNEFVDGGDTSEEDDRWPWHDAGMLGERPDMPSKRIELTDTPGGPEGRAGLPRYQFQATTSCAVRTGNRVTLIQSFTWGLEIGIGKTEAAVLWSPSIRPATASEVQEQLRILKSVAISPYKNPTGRHHDYRPPPPSGSVNE